MPPTEPNSSRKKRYNNYIRYSGIGLQVLGAVVLGHFADTWLNFSFPICTIVFSVAGILGSLYLLIRDFTRKDKD